MAHKIMVDQEKCIGCGACVATCEGSFEMKDGKAVAIKNGVEELTCEKDAESVCPVDAIGIS